MDLFDYLPVIWVIASSYYCGYLTGQRAVQKLVRQRAGSATPPAPGRPQWSSTPLKRLLGIIAIPGVVVGVLMLGNSLLALLDVLASRPSADAGPGQQILYSFHFNHGLRDVAIMALVTVLPFLISYKSQVHSYKYETDPVYRREFDRESKEEEKGITDEDEMTLAMAGIEPYATIYGMSEHGRGR